MIIGQLYIVKVYKCRLKLERTRLVTNKSLDKLSDKEWTDLAVGALLLKFKELTRNFGESHRLLIAFQLRLRTFMNSKESKLINS